LKLAALYQRRDGSSEAARQALEHANSAYAGLPIGRRVGVAAEVAEAALRLNQVDAAAVWAGRAIHDAPQTEVAQSQLRDLLVQVYARGSTVRVVNPFADIDRALAVGELQAMYDLAVDLPVTMAGVVRRIAVVERLRSAGESEAALGVLNRALDGPRVERVYWLLVRVLTDLGRYEDAELAVEALRSRNQQLGVAA
jgi:hypothetical protein